MIARRKRTAWLVLVAAQIPWTAYDIYTGQYGFLLVSASSTWIGVTAWRRWGKEPACR